MEDEHCLRKFLVQLAEAFARRGDRQRIEMNAMIDEEDLSETRADADARWAFSYFLTDNQCDVVRDFRASSDEVTIHVNRFNLLARDTMTTN